MTIGTDSKSSSESPVWAENRGVLAPNVRRRLRAAGFSRRSLQPTTPSGMVIYAGETTLINMILEVLRSRVVSVRWIRLEAFRGPLRPGNWRIMWIDVLAPDYGRFRDLADELDAKGHWIRVPDGHPFEAGYLARSPEVEA